jgi:hypothetical protein
MFGLFGSKSKRSDKFHFSIELHNLQPFPEMASNRQISIAWTRGKKRQGELGIGNSPPFSSVPR